MLIINVIMYLLLICIIYYIKYVLLILIFYYYYLVICYSIEYLYMSGVFLKTTLLKSDLNLIKLHHFKCMLSGF